LTKESERSIPIENLLFFANSKTVLPTALPISREIPMTGLTKDAH